MDRSDEIRQKADRLMEPVLRQSMENLMAGYKDHECTNLAGLQDALQELVRMTVRQQQDALKGQICYMGLCHCMSSIYTGNFGLKIDLYDECFYLDEAECSVSWEPDFIMSYFKRDALYFEKNIRKTVPRVQTYEIQKYLSGYMKNYTYILQEFLRQKMPEVIGKLSFEGLQTKGGIQVFFGDYMGKCRILFCIPMDTKGNSNEIL